MAQDVLVCLLGDLAKVDWIVELIIDLKKGAETVQGDRIGGGGLGSLT